MGGACGSGGLRTDGGGAALIDSRKIWSSIEADPVGTKSVSEAPMMNWWHIRNKSEGKVGIKDMG